MTARTTSTPTSLSDTHVHVPVVAVRIVLVISGVLLWLVDFVPSGWLAAGIALSLAAAVVPRLLLGWLVILILAAGQLGHHPVLSWRFLVLLAGLHLLHVLATMALELPWRGVAQLSVFVAPVRRFLAIQIPAQLLAVLTLWLLAPNRAGHRPVTVSGLAVVGALALVGVAWMLSAHHRSVKQ